MKIGATFSYIKLCNRHALESQ